MRAISSPSAPRQQMALVSAEMLQIQDIFCNVEWVRCPPPPHPPTPRPPIQYQGQRPTRGEPDSHDNTCAWKWQDLFSARMHQERRRKPALDDTAVSVSGARAAHSRKLEPSDRHSAFPERLSASSCNKRQQPHLKEGEKKKNGIASFSAIREKRCPRPTCASLWRRSHVPQLPWLFSGGYRRSSGCRYVCASAMLLSQRRTVRSCALHPGC